MSEIEALSVKIGRAVGSRLLAECYHQPQANWAELIEDGNQEVAVLLKKATASLQAADAALREALHRSGGELPGRAPHNHHHPPHNLPE